MNKQSTVPRSLLIFEGSLSLPPQINEIQRGVREYKSAGPGWGGGGGALSLSSLFLSFTPLLLLTDELMARELCILDDQLRHLESTAYGISSSSSVHPHPLQAPDNFPPSLPIDPSTFWHHPHHHHHLHAQPPLAPDDNRMSITLPYPSPLPLYHSPEVNTPPGGREKRHR